MAVSLLLGAVLAFAPVVRWTAPDGCPGAAAVLGRVDEFGVDPGELELVGEVVPATDGTVVLRLSLEGGPVHTYVAADCRALADVAALILAAAADPVGTARSPALAEAPAAQEVASDPVAVAWPAPAAPLVPAGPPTSPRPIERRRITGQLGVVGVVGAAQLPDLDLGVGVLLGIGIRSARFELRAAYLMPRRQGLPGVAGASIELDAWDIAPLGCGVLGKRSVRAVLCGGVELGVMRARGHGLVRPRPGIAPWVALVAAPRIEWAVGRRWRLFAGTELLVALARARFGAGNLPDATIAAGAGGLRAIIGVAAEFGRSRPTRSNRPKPET